MINNNLYEIFVAYLLERDAIYRRRAEGEPGPWTTDPILAKYKFTNVLRSRDRTSRWLIENWYQPHWDDHLEVIALNCGIARYFGRIEFLEDLGWQNNWDPTYVLETARRRFREKKPVFTGAYIITNQGMTDPKEEVVVNHFLSPYRNALGRLVEIATTQHSWESVARAMKGMPGMGPFMTKEILLDWQYTPLLKFASDRLTWTPAGPGAIRGLNRLHERPLQRGMTQEQALREMKDLLARLANDPAIMNSRFPTPGVEFGVTDVQFCLCELDKYLRVRNLEGRPRSTFKPSRLEAIRG